MTYRIGVDIGGSFTDFAVFDERDGSIKTMKVFSRPNEPGREVIEGMRQLSERAGVDAERVVHFTHGTTVGVNTVIQRKGLRLGLLTTENFCDVLELARLKIADMYHLMSMRPAPLITRDRIYGIQERLDADGNAIAPLDPESVKAAVGQALAAGCEGLVVALLHSYRNPVHERAVRDIVAEMAPDLPVVLSSEVWPIIREYERTVTSVISAYVQPRVANYLTKLQEALKQAGISPELHVTKSNGGVMLAEQGKSDCIQMILSGTASGVIGASYIARLCGLENCLSLDVGGTSADVALISNGEPRFGTGEYIGDFQVFIPSVSVTSVGEGGGSIAWVDEHGILKVGPESAGSSPGPVCYGRGGTRPAITDAFAANGWIGNATLGYDAVTVDRDAAIKALGDLGARLGLDANRTAEAVIDVAVSGMYAGVSGIVSRYGVDPRSFSLLAFGGAGPMTACFLAKEVGIRHVVVPTTPGVLSALGGLIADLKNDFVKTTYFNLTHACIPDLAAAEAELRERGIRWLREEQGYDGPVEIQLSAEMRYKGQSFEIDTPIEEAWIASADVDALAKAFHAEHDRIYGHYDEDADVQVVALRLVAVGRTSKPALAQIPKATEPLAARREVSVFIGGEWRTVPLYAREDLRAGHRFTGPAIVAQPDCTTCVLDGFSARVDDYGNMHLERMD
jgi:N-methylhydantoinase A